MSSASSLRAGSNNSRRRLLRQQRHTSLERLEARCLLTASSYTWQNVAIGAGGFVDGVFYDPNNQNTIYARTDIGGLYKTIDDGQHWTQLLDFVGNNTGTSGNGTQSQLIGVLSFAIDPENSHNIYAAVGEYSGSNGAVFYSTDAGAHWSQTNLPFYVGGNSNGRAFGEQLAVDPNNSNIIFLGTNDHGLYKSTDAGHSFSSVAGFSPTSTTFVLFDSSSGSPGNASQTIYVGANATGSGTNLYVTTNAGTNWSQVAGSGTLPTGWMAGRAVLSGGNLYLGYSNQLLPNNQSSAGGLFRYNTSTGAWANITPNGITGAAFVGVAADPSNPNTLVVSTFDRYSGPDLMWRTVNANAATPTWYQLFDQSTAQNFGYYGYNNTRNNNGALYTGPFGDGTGNWAGSIAINPFNSNQLMYGTGLGIWATDNVSNGGANTKLTSVNSWYFPDYGIEFTNADWVATSATGTPLYSTEWDINGFGHTTLAQSPANGGIIPTTAVIASSQLGTMTSIDVAGSVAAAVGGVGTNNGVYSLDGGITWTYFAARPAGNATNGSIAVSTTGGTNLTMVWAASGKAPYYSINNGATWTASTGGMPTGGTIYADRANPSDFYYYTGNKIWFSSNGGASFTQQTSTSLVSGGKLAVNPTVAGDLWIAASGGLYHSSNFGLAFTKVTSNLTSTNSVIAVGAPAPGQTTPAIYVFGTVAGFLGIQRSDDGGNSWTLVNDVNHQWGGLVQYMAADPNVFGRVYLAVNGRGVIMGNPTSSLPSGWTDADIYAPGNPGWATSSVTLSNSTVVNGWTINGGGQGLSGSSFSVSSLTSSTLTTGQRIATVVTTSPNGLHVGDQVTIAGATPAAYNGTYQVSKIINATTFTYVATPGLAAATGTITASTNDQFNFAYKQISGNSKITAQLLSLTNADGGAGPPQSGIIYRAGTNPGDVYAALVQTAGNQLQFQYRTTPGGPVTTVSLGSIPVGSEYMQLVRTGNDFSAFYSADGLSWTQLGDTTTIASMPDTADAGLVATANFNSQLTSATFANVSVSVSLPGDINLDGHVNSADVGALMQALSDQDAYQTANNLSPAAANDILDVNGNGTVNFGDLQYLLNLLSSGGGSFAESAPGPSGSSSSIPVSTLLPSSNPAGNSDSSSAASVVTFNVTPTTSSASSASKPLATSTGSTSSGMQTKKISLSTVDQFFSRFDLHGASRRTAHKQAAHHDHKDSLTDALLGSKDFTV